MRITSAEMIPQRTNISKPQVFSGNSIVLLCHLADGAGFGSVVARFIGLWAWRLNELSNYNHLLAAK
jgi:hypothetical protein